MIRAVDDQMLHTLRCLVLQVTNEINHAKVWLEEAARYLLNPPWYGGRKHETLDVGWSLSLDSAHDLFNFFLEAQVEHAVCLIKNRIA